MEKIEKISSILDRLLDDADTENPLDRFYKISDKDMLAAINILSEYFVAKEQRISSDAIKASTKPIEIIHIKAKKWK